MIDSEFQQYVKLAKRYILAGRNYYEEITPEDLAIETLLIISENDITNTITEEVFWKWMIKARSKMVKNILNGDLKRKMQHLKIVKQYYRSNIEELRKRSRINYEKKCQEQGKEPTGAGAPKGTKHGKFVGIVVTPYGEFESSYEAAKALQVSHRCIQYRCKTSSFKEWYIRK